MNWNIRLIDLEDVPSIAIQGKAMAKTGNPLVEQIRCVYALEDPKILYFSSLLDYIDNPPEKISKFYLCQMAS